MKWRFQIATSVFFAVVAIVLTVFWVRSYTWEDRATISFGDSTFYSLSRNGGLTFGVSERDISAEGWSTRTVKGFRAVGLERFHIQWTRRNIICYWQLVSVSVGFTVMPWLPFRFGLRTLLTIITLMAVSLAFIAALLH